MHEVLLLLTGVLIGTVITSVGLYFGVKIVKLTYTEMTYPQEIVTNTQGENTSKQPEVESYDWDEYQSQLTPPLGDDGGEPEA